MPSRCECCGAPLAISFAQWDKAKHPRKANGEFGSGDSAPPPGLPLIKEQNGTGAPAIQDAQQRLRDAGMGVDAPVNAVSPSDLRRAGLGGMASQFDGTVAGSAFDGQVYIATNTKVYKDAANGNPAAQTMLASVVSHEALHAAGEMSELACYKQQLAAFDKMGGGSAKDRQLIVKQIEFYKTQPVPTSGVRR